MAETGGLHLYENLIGLEGIEVDFAKLKLAVELGGNESSGGAGHVD